MLVVLYEEVRVQLYYNVFRQSYLLHKAVVHSWCLFCQIFIVKLKVVKSCCVFDGKLCSAVVGVGDTYHPLGKGICWERSYAQHLDDNIIQVPRSSHLYLLYFCFLCGTDERGNCSEYSFC